MSEKFSDGCFTISPPKARGLGRLPREQQRLKIQGDTRDWLRSGHAITQLPTHSCPGIYPAYARGDDDGPF